MTEPRYWCDTHHRFATERYEGRVIGVPRRGCAANRGGIMLSCQSRPFVEHRVEQAGARHPEPPENPDCICSKEVGHLLGCWEQGWRDGWKYRDEEKGGEP